MPVSEVCELPIKVHDIQDNVMSKQVGNSTCIFSTCFYSA